MDESKQSGKDKKIDSVKQLSEKVAKSKTLAFADYRGLTVNQLAELRDQIKKDGGELIIAKNTLIKRALLKNKYKITDSNFTGPTATVFSYEDEIAPIKSISKSIKNLGLPKFKFGFFENNQLDESGLEELAKILPKEVLQAKVVGAISSPLYGVVSVLSANIRNLISVLDQKAKQS
jgi:large subunit ribosomal protein L10